MKQKQIRPGMKVKVYGFVGYHKCVMDQSRYGEVIGVAENKKLLLAERKDFATLKLCDFDLFRASNDVEFISPSSDRDVVVEDSEPNSAAL
jgi:hypothetical protein